MSPHKLRLKLSCFLSSYPLPDIKYLKNAIIKTELHISYVISTEDEGDDDCRPQEQMKLCTLDNVE